MDDLALNTLFQHDRWATDQLLAACAPLNDDQLDRPFEMGRGSLRKTLVHMIAVIDGWHAGITGQPPQFDASGPASVDDLKTAFADVSSAFGATLEQSDSTDIWTARRKGEALSAPCGVMATHILTHGTHHRAQALNMLRHLGVNPLPPSSVVEWMMMTGVAQSQNS